MRELFGRIGKQLNTIARQLGGHDWEDIRSEMNVAICEAGPGHKDAYYLRLAKWRGKDFARAFRNRRRWARPMRDFLSLQTVAYLEAAAVEPHYMTAVFHFTTFGTGRLGSRRRRRHGQGSHRRTHKR